MNIEIEKLRSGAYHLHLAEHLLEVTYPVVNDPKMLISVLTNLESTHKNLFEAVLPANLTTADTSFIRKLSKFEELLKPNLVLGEGELRSINSVHEILEQHKESSVVFSRKDSFIICDDDYKLKMVDPVRIGEFTHNTRKLTKKLFEMVE